MTTELKTLKELEGKTIVKAEIRKKKGQEQFDDEPILELTMSDGSIFEVEGTYGGYTGDSYDEYPSFVIVRKKDEEDLA